VRLVTGNVRADNTASLRLLARLGFVESGSEHPHVRLVRAAAGDRQR